MSKTEAIIFINSARSARPEFTTEGGEIMKKSLMCVFVFWFFAATAYGASVDTFGIGPRATALGGAVSASQGDVYSIYYNPAALTDLEGGQLAVALQMMDPETKFHDYTVTGGESAITGDKLDDMGGTGFGDIGDSLYIPFLGYAQPINDKLAVGVALYVPFGLDIEYPEDTVGAMNSFHSYYLRETLTPTLSYKLSDKLSLGVGVALGMSESGAEMKLNMAAPSEVNVAFTGLDTYSTDNVQAVYDTVYAAYGGDANAEVATAAATQTSTQYGQLAYAYTVYEGAHAELEMEDDFNYSFNVGVLYKPAENVALALTYRGRTDADFEGDIKVYTNTGDVETTNVTMDYDHPEQVQVGLMVKPVPSVSLELDVVWTNWSINSVQNVLLDTEIIGGAVDHISQARNWNDTNQIRIGAEWQSTDTLALRCGYFYDPSPIPDDTFDIIWPDADRKTYSIGAGYKIGKWTIDASFQLAHAEMKRIIGGESDNLNSSYNVEGLIEGYRVETSADGYLLGYGLALSYNF